MRAINWTIHLIGYITVVFWLAGVMGLGDFQMQFTKKGAIPVAKECPPITEPQSTSPTSPRQTT